MSDIKKGKTLLSKMMSGTKIEVTKAYRQKELEGINYLGRWFKIESIAATGAIQISGKDGITLMVEAKDIVV